MRDKKNRPEPHRPQKTLRALIADDDPSSAELLQLVMVNYGFDISLAFDGKAALKQMAEEHFDLVFLDINMPELTGTEVLGKIQALHHKHSHPRKPLFPIVIYSSTDRSTLKLPDERGFYIVGHWQKPITLPELTALTGRAVSQLGLN